jgi:hypothetical protein
MSENASATSRTRHVDARYHFVREFVEEGFLKVVFVKSQDNKSDIFTKNITGDLYDVQVKNYVAAKEEIGSLVMDVPQEGCWNIVSGTSSSNTSSTSTANESRSCVTPVYSQYCTEMYRGVKKNA